MKTSNERDYEFHFTRSRIFDQDVLYVAGVRSDLEDENKKHTFIFKRTKGVWTRSFIDNRVADFAAYEGPSGRTLLAIAEDGEVIEGPPAKRREVASTQTARAISDDSSVSRESEITLFTVGMRRRIYRSDLEGLAWA